MLQSAHAPSFCNIVKEDSVKFQNCFCIKSNSFIFQDGEEAAALVKELVLIVQRLGACSGRMEEGALRVDANVSLRRVGAPLSTRTEVQLQSQTKKKN